ncbi:polysaccharide lyase family 8 super-sandwich domain-containing protein [Alistipes shahii]|uniref:polysaccharide lyase family 8 super-sandwich domain-containing protein n=2 Tax=Alistipes shahii TaxID=328814 RepID=UPI003AF87725
MRQAFVDVSVMSYAPDGEATERFVRYSDYGRANDVLLLQLYTSVHLPDGEVRRLLGLFDAGGFWSDIDYDDRTRGRWQPSLHLTRMYALAKLYADPASAWHGDGRIGGLLHKGLTYWYAKKPSSLNWWHGEIGVPKKLAAILLMIRGELSGPELEQGLRIIERSRFGRTGQNKVWLAGNNLMRGLLTDDEALVAEARDQIAEEIVVTDGEGIQDDWSFHQHGPQIQFGNYGLAYAEGLSFWLRVLDGTPYMFSDAQCAVIEKLMREGICRSIWRGVMDPSFCGRQVFIDSGPGKASSAAVAAENIAALKRPGYRVFRRFAKRILEPENRSDGLRGPRYYDRSDCGIYRTATWYASIRMHSDRTIGFEFTNRENTLANFSADGALLFMQHGREYDNIFAHWDWRMVPGTTAYDDGAPLKCDNSVEARKNRSGHVGGLASGDVLCTTMEIERDGLHALKSAFFFGDLVVALGADIRSSDARIFRITTALDQTHLAGPVTRGGATETSGSLPWGHHDGRGYVSLDGAPIAVSTEIQEGKWDLIDPFYRDRTQRGPVFKCWFGHDPARTGGYAYAFLPCRDAKRTERFARNPSVRILRNDAGCQAVEYGKICCAVVHRAGEYRLGGRTITAPEPAIYLLRGGRTEVRSLPPLNGAAD